MLLRARKCATAAAVATTGSIDRRSPWRSIKFARRLLPPGALRIDADDGDDKLREECGVLGMLQPRSGGGGEAGAIADISIQALSRLQHRGLEGAGIVTCDDRGFFHEVKGLGLVSKVFDAENVQELLKGNVSSIGHVRYGTAGSSSIANVQPFGMALKDGTTLWIAHNGNIVNYEELRHKLERKGCVFHSSSDSEVILHLVNTCEEELLLSKICVACEQLDGAFSLIFMTSEMLVAVRDPRGFRPLVMGFRQNGTVVFASETCAFNLIDARYDREVEPGEVLVATKSENGRSSVHVEKFHDLRKDEALKHCLFELFYLARPDSFMFSHSVYLTRYQLGELLAEDFPVECDFAMAVPDSGMVSLLGYATKLGLPIQQGLIRSHDSSRTFIQPKNVDRRRKVLMKLAPVPEILKGKRVVVVDDSIVRGTTSKIIVEILRSAGAKEVHLRIPSPPVIDSCYYGVDTPTKKELLLFNMSVSEARRYVGADSLEFLSLDRIKNKMRNGCDFCDACFSGNHTGCSKRAHETVAFVPLEK